jgi:hypothetical protein
MLKILIKDGYIYSIRDFSSELLLPFVALLLSSIMPLTAIPILDPSMSSLFANAQQGIHSSDRHLLRFKRSKKYVDGISCRHIYVGEDAMDLILSRMESMNSNLTESSGKWDKKKPCFVLYYIIM